MVLGVSNRKTEEQKTDIMEKEYEVQGRCDGIWKAKKQLHWNS